MNDSGSIEIRSLTGEERRLLDWLLVNGSSDAPEYAQQLDDVKVVGRCTCGCPSIDLAMGDRQERIIGPSHELAEFEGITAEGVKVQLILHSRQGQISGLEVFAIDDDSENPFGLPTIESLKPTNLPSSSRNGTAHPKLNS